MAAAYKISEQFINEVERAVSELRRGYLVEFANSGYVIASPECIDHPFFNQLVKKYNTESFLLITETRASFYFKKKFSKPLLIKTKNIPDIESISGLNLSKNNAKKISIQTIPKSINPIILRLCRFAEIMPALILIKINSKIRNYCKKNGVLSVSGKAISEYENSITYSMKPASETPLVLKEAKNSKIIAFRPKNGNKEHYAIIIGKPEKEPLIRIHSSCYTGDLLGSLRCDCRDQLHETISYMSKNKGGVILYLMQEGRGIGLVNKLRTYNLQCNGLDTVDANNYLGFDDDERPFLPAAIMLKQLGYNSVCLVTNNPKKAAGLKRYGIRVKKMVPIIIKSQQYNQNYLATKSRRLGHKI